jgi:predicted nucleotidyltransferase
MRRTDALNVLRQHLPVLRKRFGVREVAVFGSTARDEASDRSDIDVLVTFETGAHVGFFKLAELKDFLEGALDRSVDLLTPASLHPRIRDRVLKEAVRAG